MKWMLLTSLLLTWNLVSTVRCPDKCKCTKRTVRCERQKLQTIPRNIPTAVTELYLGYNLLDGIPAYAFRNLTKLKILSLKGNQLITDKIDKNALRGLRSLRELYLTSNKLQTLPRELFVDLTNITKLYISQNKLTAVPDLGFCVQLVKLGLDNNKLDHAQFPAGYTNLTKLSTVVLSDNPLEIFNYTDIKSLQQCPLRKINLARCKLKTVDVSAFTVFPKLQSLDISYNKELDMTSIRNIIDGLSGSQLAFLGLSNVIKSSTIPADLFKNFIKVPLRTLDMSHMDGVAVIQNGTFQYLYHLDYLDLSYSKLIIINAGSFGDKDTKMTRLNLAYNSLQLVPVGLPHSLTQLDISNNKNIDGLVKEQFSNLENLKNLTLAYCAIQTVENDAFLGAGKLLSLDLSYNRIGGSNLGNKVLFPLINLRTLSLRGNLMTEIPTQSGLFSQLTNLVELDMAVNHCKNLALGIFSPLVSLKSLDLSKNNLGKYFAREQSSIFENLTKLESLTIENSYLYNLPENLFTDLSSVKKLDLSHNVIDQWGSGLFLHTKNLQYLDLSHNSIAVVNQTSVTDLPKNLTVDLSSNPFACWCDLIWFRNWMTNTTRVHLINNVTYKCNSPKSMIGKHVLQFNPAAIADNCNPPPWIYILIGTSLAVAVVVFIVGTVLYRNRWPIRLKIYRMRKRRNRQTRDGYSPIQGDDTASQYDVYISYGPANEDVQWVHQKLVMALDKTEGGNWNTCFEARNIHGNKSDIGQIDEAIDNSRRFILVLSPAYLKNKRREYEIELVFAAIFNRSADAKDTILPIILSDEVSVRDTASLLGPILTDNNILRWTENTSGQELFWDRLKTKLGGDREHNEESLGGSRERRESPTIVPTSAPHRTDSLEEFRELGVTPVEDNVAPTGSIQC